MSLPIYIGAATVAAGSAWWVNQQMKPKKKVELLRPRDNRIKILEVDQETDLGLRCKKSDGIVHTFIKAGRGWTVEGRNRITKFFGAEGTVYTAIFRDGDAEEVTLREILKLIWGEDFFASVPKIQKDLLDTAKVGVTVTPIKISPTEYGLEELTSADIDNQSDNIMLDKIATGDSGRPTVYNNLLYIAIGALAMYFALTRGII